MCVWWGGGYTIVTTGHRTSHNLGAQAGGHLEGVGLNLIPDLHGSLDFKE